MCPDVYKRQALPYDTYIIEELRSDSNKGFKLISQMCIRDRYHDRILSSKPQIPQYMPFPENSCPITDYSIKDSGQKPVSYTHLDVYKRQTFLHFQYRS